MTARPHRARSTVSRPLLITGLVVVVVAVIGIVVGYRLARPAPDQPVPVAAASDIADGDLTFTQLTDPQRTVVRTAKGVTVATFTEGARTVLLVGPSRTFTEPAFTTATVTTTAWVRLAPQEWHSTDTQAAWLRPWLVKEVADRGPDMFAVAMQYIHDAPGQRSPEGVQYAGDASFGPLDSRDPDGRAEANDFLDYLGQSWSFPDVGEVTPKASRLGDIDCSGFLRMVYGYRLGYPLRGGNGPGPGLPRRAFAMSRYAGVEIVPDRRTAVPADDYARLQPGDLIFFDTDPSTVDENDHSGIFLGTDDGGHLRFISSRAKADGPTMGDYGGPAILDGGGHFSRTFRNARRL